MNPTHSTRLDPVYGMRGLLRAPEPNVGAIEGILQRYRDLAGAPESEAANLSLMHLHFELVAEMRNIPASADDACRRLAALESSLESVIYQPNDRAALRKSLVDHWKLSMSPIAIKNCVDSVKNILQSHGIPVGDRIELGSTIELAALQGTQWEDLLIDAVGPLVSKRITSQEERARVFRRIESAYANASETISLQ